MSQKKRYARRQVYCCRVCDVRIPIILRTDRRTCSDVCRKWSQRHPGRKRVYRMRGKVRLPLKVSLRKPKTLAEALRLLAETRAYAAKLEASAEALALELTHQENAQAELRAELIRERERTSQGGDVVTAAQQRAQTAEQKVAELEKQLAEAKAEPKKPRESAPESRETAHADRDHRPEDRPPRAPTSEERERLWTSRRDERRRESYGPPSLLGSVLDHQRRWRDDENGTSRMARAPARSDTDTAAADAVIGDLRRQITSLTNELDRARRLRGEERRGLLDDIEDQKTALRTLNKELQDQAAAQAEWNREKESLTKQNEDRRAQSDTEVAGLRKDLAASVSEREALSGKLSSVNDTLAKEQETLRARVSELSSELRKETDKGNARVAEQERERAGLEQKIASLRADHAGLGDKYSALQNEVGQWQAKVGQAMSAEGEALKKLADERSAAGRLRQSVREKEQQIATLVNEKKERDATQQEQRRVSEQRAKEFLVSIDQQQREDRQRIQEQENERAELQRIVAELRSKIGTQQSEISTLKAQIAEQRQTVDEQRNQLAAVAKERQEWAAEKKEREAKQQELRKKSEEVAKGFLNSIEKQQREDQQRIQELENERTELQRVVGELQAKIETQKAEILSLQRDLVAHGQTVEGYKKELAAIAEERKQWAAEKAELERSRDEHKGHTQHERYLRNMKEEALRNELRRTQERVSQEAKEMVGSAERTLEIERERRQSVEAMNEELREAMRRIELAALDSDGTPAWTAAQQEQALLLELKSLRQQRDGVSNERDLLSRRLLR